MESGSEASVNGDSPARQATVLILEDDFWTRYTAAASLRAMGHRVIEGQDVAEGIRVLTSGVRIDLIFSDINMPGTLNGLGFADWIEQHHPHIPVLLTSGAPQGSGAPPAVASRPFIAKPYDLDEVDRLLRGML